MRGAARAIGVVVAASLAMAACSGGDSKPTLKKPVATTTTLPPVNISDPVSLNENKRFSDLVHQRLPQFCGLHTLYRRNINTPPSLHFPPIGGEAECTVWHQDTTNYSFMNPANVTGYVRARTARECALSRKASSHQALAGLHWVLRPHSATLVTSNDFMHELAAVLGGQPHTQFCAKPTNYVGSWNEMSAINTLMQQHNVNCGTLVVDATDPLYQGKLLLDANGRPAAIHALCSANPTVQVIGITPTLGDPIDKANLAKLQQYFCRQNPNLHAITGITGMMIVPDATLAQQIGAAVGTPVQPVCS